MHCSTGCASAQPTCQPPPIRALGVFARTLATWYDSGLNVQGLLKTLCSVCFRGIQNQRNHTLPLDRLKVHEMQGYLTPKKPPPSLGPPQEPGYGPTVWSYGVAVSKRGTPVVPL